MCFSGSHGAANAAEQQNQMLQDQFNQSQAQQQAQFDSQQARADQQQGAIASAMGGVNDAFSGRGNVYRGLENATFNMNRDQLTENRDNSAQKLKFALARGGLTGGSVDVDKNGQLLDRFNNGLLRARSYASDVGARARGADEQLRASLLGMAGSGAIGGGQAYQMASQGLQSNAAVPSFLPGINNIFSDLTNAIGQAAQMQGMRQGFGQERYNSTFPKNPGSTYGGTVTGA